MALYTEPYDVADYLDSPEMIVAYLNEALETKEPRFIAKALAAVARARGGMEKLSADTNIPVAELHAALEETQNPKLEMMIAVLNAFGLQFSARPISTKISNSAIAA